MSSLQQCETDHRVMTTGDVVRATPVVVKPGDFPARVVLRDVSQPGKAEYVVHLELLRMDPSPDRDHLTVALKHDSFQHGSYCSGYPRALEVFEERSKALFR